MDRIVLLKESSASAPPPPPPHAIRVARLGVVMFSTRFPVVRSSQRVPWVDPLGRLRIVLPRGGSSLDEYCFDISDALGMQSFEASISLCSQDVVP